VIQDLCESTKVNLSYFFLYLYSLGPFLSMIHVVLAVMTMAALTTELSICETVTVTKQQQSTEYTT